MRIIFHLLVYSLNVCIVEPSRLTPGTWDSIEVSNRVTRLHVLGLSSSPGVLVGNWAGSGVAVTGMWDRWQPNLLLHSTGPRCLNISVEVSVIWKLKS